MPVPSPPGRLLARALRAPAALYGADLGWVLGHRFLALTHRGRRSGRRYTVVLEVIRWRPETREAVVMSGFGSSAQWYRNVLAGGAEQVSIARLSFAARARVLEPDEAVAALAAYERSNRLIAPVLRIVLSRLAGFPYDGSDAARRRTVEVLPLVALAPVERSGPDR